ncbi:MAG: hypothetical protein H0T18_03955, partial [Chloroflexia bacterium]|nr:hypothetical protein [Chloroflexia bacterium]
MWFPNRLAPRSPGVTILAAMLSLLTTLALALPALALFQDESTTQPLRGVFT